MKTQFRVEHVNPNATRWGRGLRMLRTLFIYFEQMFLEGAPPWVRTD